MSHTGAVCPVGLWPTCAVWAAAQGGCGFAWPLSLRFFGCGAVGLVLLAVAHPPVVTPETIGVSTYTSLPECIIF